MCGRYYSLAMEMEVGDDNMVGPSRLGYYKTPNYTANVTHATRASPAPAYDARRYSVHWRKAKMCMRIPSSYINSYAYDRTAAINLQGILGMHLMCRVETGLSHENLPIYTKVSHPVTEINCYLRLDTPVIIETSWLNGQHQSLTKVASNYS